jgi:hypothetical protein
VMSHSSVLFVGVLLSLFPYVFRLLPNRAFVCVRVVSQLFSIISFFFLKGSIIFHRFALCYVTFVPLPLLSIPVSNFFFCFVLSYDGLRRESVESKWLRLHHELRLFPYLLVFLLFACFFEPMYTYWIIQLCLFLYCVCLCVFCVVLYAS